MNQLCPVEGGEVRVAVCVGLSPDLHEAVHGHERSEEPEPTHEDVGACRAQAPRKESERRKRHPTAFPDFDRAEVIASSPPEPAGVRRALGHLLDGQHYPRLVAAAPRLPGDAGIAIRATNAPLQAAGLLLLGGWTIRRRPSEAHPSRRSSS